MSQEMMDPEIIADFIIEAKEHLETIEPNLLELEKDPSNLSLLNDIFRPMHSLKGASGFLGFNLMNGLAHRAENILDELRKGTMGMTAQIMDVILEATDMLRQIIDNLETANSEGEVETSQLILEIDTIMEKALSGGQTASEPESSAIAGTVDESSPVTDDFTLENSHPVQEATPEATEQNTPQVEGGAGGPARQQIGDVEEWLETRPEVEAYTLVSFGEGHLQDFIEEAKENTTSLSELLLDFENQPENDEIINDMFRLFHNLKGNSGIIGYQELNSLTHEVETLLNNVRRHEFAVTPPLIDMLLLVVDVLEALILRINPDTGHTKPFDTAELVDKLQQIVAGGPIEMPESILVASEEDPPRTVEVAASVQVPDSDESEDMEDDLATFTETIDQQHAAIAKALDELGKDGSNREMIDALFRSLTTIKNACGFMGFDEIKTYAMRTADIVDKSRDTGMDFSLLHDLLDQECAIIRDLINDKVASLADSLPNDNVGGTQATGQTLPSQTAASHVSVDSPAQQDIDKDHVQAQSDRSEPAHEGKQSDKETVLKDSGPVLPASEKTKPKDTVPVTPAESAAPPSLAPARQAPATAKPPVAPAKDEAPKTSSTIRVDHEKLDHLMNVIGELIINRNRFSMLARQLEDLDTSTEVDRIATDLSETTYAMARISDDLQATIMKVRMVPVASVFSRFPRLVRDLSRKSNKDVELVVSGEDTELDKSVVEVIGDPLVHLIRNSVDHGIESAEDRIAAGKSPKGTVTLRAFYKGNSVAIEIEDDGKGIDPEKMREVGIRKGIITPEEAKQLEDREAIELIFAPGFSSAEKITDISGRGVGMDVVRTNIKGLKGTINISSVKGKGTTFTMSLPLTLAIIDALMVDVAGETFAIPLDAVSETTKLEASRLTDMKGRKAVTLRGDVLGIVSLAEILGLPSNMNEQELLSVVVIHDNDRRLGVVVDALHDRQEIVIKPLGEYLGDIQGISGATIMGDGSVILILDPHEMYMLATKNA